MVRKDQREKSKASKQETSSPSQPSSKSKKKGFLQRHYVSLIVGTLALPIVLVLWPVHLTLATVPLERVPLSEMSVDRFLNEFSTQKPVVVTGAWSADGWMPEQIAGACPEATIRTFRHDSGSSEWGKLVQVGAESLKDYFAVHFASDESHRPKPLLYGFEMPLKFHCPEKLEIMSVPSFLTEDAFHMVTNHTGLGWPSVLMGPVGSETGLHIDTHRLPFWIAVVGAPDVPLKRFRVFPHSDRHLLKYGRPSKTANFLFDFDPWEPNFRKYPEVADSFVYEGELRTGDLLYIPGGSPHAVKNLADNAGISMNYLDLKSMPDFVRKATPSSPLYHALKGAGEWVIGALESRRKHHKAMSYYEFAGVRDRSEFCEAHRETKDNGERPAGLARFCDS